MSNVDIVPGRIISTPSNFAADIQEMVSREKCSSILLPWDHSEGDDAMVSDIANSLFALSSVPVALFSHSAGDKADLSSEAKILVLFGGGEDDCAALELVLDFNTPILLFLCKRQKNRKTTSNKTDNDYSSSSSTELQSTDWPDRENQLISRAKSSSVTTHNIPRSVQEVVDTLDQKLADTKERVSLVVVGRNYVGEGLGKVGQQLIRSKNVDVVVVAAPKMGLDGHIKQSHQKSDIESGSKAKALGDSSKRIKEDPQEDLQEDPQAESDSESDGDQEEERSRGGDKPVKSRGDDKDKDDKDKDD